MNTICTYPLTETIHKPYIDSCGLSCGSGVDPPIYYQWHEARLLRKIVFILSFMTIIISMIYLCKVQWELNTMNKKFCILPFPYQAPSFISAGYLLIGLSTVSPIIFRTDSIICNHDEHSLVIDGVNNFYCSLSALSLWLGIRIAATYSCALSGSLFLALYYPCWKQYTWVFHAVVVTIILGFLLLMLLDMDISGDYYLGICTPTLSRKENILLMEIVPLSSMTFIFAVTQLLSAWKLWRSGQDARKSCVRQSGWCVQIFRMDQDMKLFQNRVLCYNMLQVSSLLILLGNFYYRWKNIDQWNDTLWNVIKCEIKKTEQRKTDYDECVTKLADLPRPSAATYWLFPCSSMIGVMGGVFFQCFRMFQTRTYRGFQECGRPFLDTSEASYNYSLSTSAYVVNNSSILSANSVPSDIIGRACQESIVSGSTSVEAKKDKNYI